VFLPAPSIAAVLVLLVGSVLPATPSIRAEGAGTPVTASAPADEPPASVTEVPEPEHGPTTPPPAAATTDGGRRRVVFAASNPWSVPEVLLDAYRQAVAGSSTACHLPVSLLAAIGEVESGSLAGRSIDASHRVAPPVLGPLLNGVNTAAIRDTDGGALDGSSLWDRAVGPMQFIPGTWARFGIDGDGDGRADPQNVYDATASAAGYLCAGGRDLAQPSGLRSAILSYNHSTAYLATVLAWQQKFTATGGRTRGISLIDIPRTPEASVPTTLTATHPTPGRTGTPIHKGPGSSNPVPVDPAAPHAAWKLAFTTSPSPATTSGIALATQPVIAVQDSAGSTVTSDTSAVTLTLTDPGGATLTCDSDPEVASSGVARFSGCAIDKAGTYTMSASDGSLAAATSTSITVVAGPAASLAFVAGPSFVATSGTALATQPVVAAQDWAGNLVAADARSVTLSLSDPSGAALVCDSNTETAVSGIARFSGCAIDKTGIHTLRATSGSLTAATSTSVTVFPGVPAAVAVVVGSGQSAVVGGEFTSRLVARVTDANANAVPDVSVTFAAPDSPAGASATFAGSTRTTAALTDAGGHATSSLLTANTVSGAYHLTATAGSAHATFTLTNSPGAATRFAITSTPVTGPASTTADLGVVTVQLQDVYGNPVDAPAGGTDVALTSDSAGTTVFAETLAGASVTSLTIPGGASTAAFYYGDSVPGNPVITVSGLLLSATQKETITAGPAPATATATTTGP